MQTNKAEEFVRITLVGSEKPLPTLLDVSAFLYDFNLLYEYVRLAVDPQYSQYDFDRPFSWTRNNRPLLNADRLRVVQLRHESPLLLVAALPAVAAGIAAVWGVLQITEKIVDWPLDREKKRLDVEKLRVEVRNAGLPDAPTLQAQLTDRQAIRVIDRTITRLNASPMRVSDIKVDIVPELPAGTVTGSPDFHAADVPKRTRTRVRRQA
jgi:hypothetical protein